MIDRPFDDITADDIQALADNEVGESRTLDYKQSLPGKPDEERREFLADISSFANASGGDILFGVTEKRDEGGKCTGVPGEITGIPEVNIDAVKLALESIVRDNIEPRLPGFQIRAIEGFPQGPLVLIRIRQSWLSPHMVTYKGSSRFYSRNSAGKYPLDVTELRSAFLLSEGKAQRITRFRDERLAKLVADETPIPLVDGARLVMHVLPLAGQEAGPRYETPLPLVRDDPDFQPLFCRDNDDRYNLDGLVRYQYNPDTGKSLSYLQMFRNGGLEAVLVFGSEPGPIAGAALETDIIEGLNRYRQGGDRVGVTLPLVVMLGVFGAKGYWVQSERHNRPNGHTIDRDNLLLPDVMIEDSETETDVLLRPVFDALWQASGWSHCRDYDDQGRHMSTRG